MRVADRRAWGERVAKQLAEGIPDLTHVVFLAGERYREFLIRHFADRGIAMSVPMEGLRISEQLNWLGQHSPQPPGESEAEPTHRLEFSRESER
jgi:hypothetical protein